MLLHLVSASNAENAETLWGFIGRYWPGVTPQSHPRLSQHVEHAIHYFRDFVLPTKKFRVASDTERAALMDLRDALSQLPSDSTAEKIQEVVYEIGRRPPFLDTSGKSKAKDGKPGVSLEWFNMLYQVLLGQEKGPRFGSFAAVYGLGNTIDMIDGALARTIVDSDLGKHIKTTKQLAATRQIQAAIEHFWKDEYECAIILAAAAEGLLPDTDEPHIFSVLRKNPAFKNLDINRIITWLKHPTPNEPNNASISEFEAAFIIMRALTKLYAIHEQGTEEMLEFGRWAFKAGHLPMPNDWPKKTN